MLSTIFVISDLHLGGAAATASSPTFQICSEEGLQHLADFVQSITPGPGSSRQTSLVLNGDVVDFLAEHEFVPFTADDKIAAKKLEAIIERTSAFWTSLESFVRANGRLTFMLGNHDAELSFPSSRDVLRRRVGDSGVDFIFDNRALNVGPVLVEHGNRYDRWNLVDYDKLREIASALSRGETPPTYLGPPGSQLVAQVMNPLKRQYSFVDLLKPENGGVLPILAIFDPSSMRAITKLARLARETAKFVFDERGAPVDPANISVQTDREADLLEFSRKLARGGRDAEDIGAVDALKGFVERVREAVTQTARKTQLDLLYQAFRRFSTEHRQSFDVNHEDDVYLTPAKASAGRGFKVIVYGHTHLVKRVPLGPQSVYLNTGTWADVIKLPEDILSGNQTAAIEKLDGFVTDLLNNSVEKWRRQVPTFARIDLADDSLISADVFFFNKDRSTERVRDGRLERLFD